ncbi:heavy metal translocating P-type ATPase [Brumicola pallidula]|jgi:Cu2+-exporting ATPase|uniref:Cu2+-exporting ATPase n=1 Tax=Brumicola pallidula DSM 14239 = ACAM 615 TaxID=1121922 RepID=K6YZE8_9ALTE|nr:heavy metal translocating P-type ATPase [Glaciecola pallidula]GAC29296.1 Cu2+-exporting ATPase [Glaciecola pallidula DSM 14239 = ACAM 615]
MAINVSKGDCFHCGLPNLEGDKYPVTILHKTHNMCCPGCQAVASAIVENGLESYYQFRTEPATKGDSALDNTMNKLAVYDEPELQEEFVFENGKHKQIQLTVEGITCAACGWLIEKQLAKVVGVKQVSVNVGARRAMIAWNDKEIKLSGLLKQLKNIGYESLPFQADKHEASFQNEQKSYLKKLGLAGLMTMQVMMLAMAQYFDLFGDIDAESTRYFNWISLVLTTPVVLYSGSVFYLSALKATMAKTINMDISVTVAILSTYIAGFITVNQVDAEVYFESICMFVFFLLISRYLEQRTRHKANQISSNMLKHIPVTAYKWINGELTSVLAKQLQVNDLVLVKAGEIIPVDGEITEGHATIDESMLTGEFESVDKRQGAYVYGGTINQLGVITIKVTKTLKYAMVNQILRLQETAMANKPKVALLADRLSRHFSIIVLAFTAFTYAFWYLQDSPHAFWIAISVLVATCPCALGLATPSALTCAMAKLNKGGILLKRADALEQLTDISDIVFDKTGTLTCGEFSIQKVWVADGSQKDALLSIATALEVRSEHPIAKAFSKLDIDIKHQHISNFRVSVGNGISGNINGHLYQLGSANFIGIDNENQFINELNDATIVLAKDDCVVAAFWLADKIKHDVADVLKTLSGYETSILSGDSEKNVRDVALKLGIGKTYAQRTPLQKLDTIKTLQQQGKKVLMLGDGINDAPVLAAADVSVAVGNASDLAKNAADVILLNAQLDSLVLVLTMAKRARRKIKQNMVWAIGYNVLVLPLAMAGFLTPWMAALGMSISSIIVVYNSTRLLKD